MNRYTVVHSIWVDEELAELWLTATNRASVTAASNAIDRELREGAESKGELIRGDLRKLALGPLWVYYTVHPDDRLVKLWSVRTAKPATGGS